MTIGKVAHECGKDKESHPIGHKQVDERCEPLEHVGVDDSDLILAKDLYGIKSRSQKGWLHHQQGT